MVAGLLFVFFAVVAEDDRVSEAACDVTVAFCQEENDTGTGKDASLEQI